MLSDFCFCFLGKGVFAGSFIAKGSFVTEYRGRLICDSAEAKKIEMRDPTYLYEFKHVGDKYW